MSITRDLPPMSVLIDTLMRYVEHIGVELPLSKHPECWEHQLDEQWRLFWNGHDTPKESSTGSTVPAFHLYVEYNGWPAGVVPPVGSGWIAAGDCANEDALIAVLEAKLATAPRGPESEGGR